MKPLSYAVRLVQNDYAESTQTRYQQYLQWAINCFNELRYKVIKGVEIEYLQLNKNGIAKLPSDYHDYTKAGVIVGGHVLNLSVNKDLTKIVENPHKPIPCPEEMAEAVSKIAYGIHCGDLFDMRMLYQGHYRNGNFVGEMYGYGGGYNENGYFQIDKQRGLIQINSIHTDAEFILEYISDGKVGEQTLIDMNAAHVIRKGIIAQRTQFDSKANLTDKATTKDDYNYALTEYKINEHTPTYVEYMDYIADTNNYAF